MTALNLVLPIDQARVNVTYEGANGELPDPIMYDSTDGDVKGWLTEALRTGGIPGIPAAPTATLADFVVDRFAATEERPYNFIMIRPKTPFGANNNGPSDEDLKAAATRFAEAKGLKGGKALDNTNAEDAKATTSDIVVYGDPNMWELVCKASSRSQGWMKSTKKMKVQGGYLFQVTTEFRNEDGDVVGCAEALTFVPMQSVGVLNG